MGCFLARQHDIAAFFDGARHGRHEAWTALELEAEACGASLLDLLHRRLNDDTTAAATARHWWRWEQTLAGHADGVDSGEPDAATLAALIARYRIQSHYLRHGCWLTEPPLLERCAALPLVPTQLLHGRLDRICAPEAGEALHAAAPHSTLRWIDAAGHDPRHPGMIDAMVTSLDTFAAHGRFDDGAAL